MEDISSVCLKNSLTDDIEDEIGNEGKVFFVVSFGINKDIDF